jgi:hypothetical protein
MLVIRNAQKGALGDAAVHDFIDRTVRHIAHEYPDIYRIRGSEDTAEFVRRTVHGAMRDGIRTVGALAVLIELKIEYGEKFELAPTSDREWARILLAHPVLPDYLKLEAVRERFAKRTDGRRIVPASTRGAS